MSGCGGGGGPKELAPDQFYRAQPPGTDESQHVLLDKPDNMYNNVHVDLAQKGPQNLLGTNEASAPGQTVTSVSSVSKDLAAQISATQPTGAPADAATTRVSSVKPSSGEYMTVGAVVVEVNGEPIYANKVLAKLQPVLSVEAKQRDQDNFRAFAANEIQKEVYSLINDDLIYAQANQTLNDDEKALAKKLTMDWRAQQIIDAGGSVEQAKARFAGEGLDFDQAAEDKYRQTVTAIYIDKKIRPKVQVTAQDMRDYYAKHLKDEFSEPDMVTYRLIKISVEKAGSREAALKRISDIYNRARAGADFQSLATKENDDPRLARSGGLEEPTQRGALRNDKLNDALFSTKQGNITSIIDGGDAFYLAKVESVKMGRVQPFDDPGVQKTIHDILSKEQMQPLLRREQDKSMANGVIVPYPPLLAPVIEMAMQKYPQWASAK
jgi:parvulin-like peptidyl-prolyl isomerase